MIKDYLNLPDEVDGLKGIYAISILDWEEFKELAQRFLLYSYDFLKYRAKITADVKMFDFIIAMILQAEKEEDRVKGIEDFQRLISLTTHQEAKLLFNPASSEWVFKIGESGELNKHNFDDYKAVVLRQNLLFEPLTAPNEIAQKVIDDAIARMSKKGGEVSLEAMIAVVSVVRCLSPDQFKNYSYYQLRADYEISQRIEMNRVVHLYKSQGGNGDVIEMVSELSIHQNPYGFDALFSKVDMKKEEALKKALSK